MENHTTDRAQPGAASQERQGIRLDATSVSRKSYMASPMSGVILVIEDEKDLVAALFARSQGADISDVLPNAQWETLFATLLSILLKKGLIADWEFIDEWTRGR